MISRQRGTVLLSAWFAALALATAGCGGGGSNSPGTNSAGIAAAEDGAADKVTCSVNADCDSDEVCTNGKCTGLPDPCTSNADCNTDEVCTNGNCV